MQRRGWLFCRLCSLESPGEEKFLAAVPAGVTMKSGLLSSQSNRSFYHRNIIKLDKHVSQSQEIIFSHLDPEVAFVIL